MKKMSRIQNVLGMADERPEWERKVFKLVSGALGEYAKLKYSREAQWHDYWSNEISRLLRKAEEYWDSNKHKTTTGFKRDKAFIQVYSSVCAAQDQVTAATNIMISSYLHKMGMDIKEFHRMQKNMELDAEVLTKEMLKEFSPKLFKLID